MYSSTEHKALYRPRRTPCQSRYLSLSRQHAVTPPIPRLGIGVPLDITFPSAHHSPNTVNRNANEFVIGTVRLNSATKRTSTEPNSIHPCTPPSPVLPSPKSDHSLPLLLPLHSQPFHGTKKERKITHQPSQSAKRTTRSPSNSQPAAPRTPGSAANPQPSTPPSGPSTSAIRLSYPCRCARARRGGEDGSGARRAG